MYNTALAFEQRLTALETKQANTEKKADDTASKLDTLRNWIMGTLFTAVLTLAGVVLTFLKK